MIVDLFKYSVVKYSAVSLSAVQSSIQSWIDLIQFRMEWGRGQVTQGSALQAKLVHCTDKYIGGRGTVLTI